MDWFLKRWEALRPYTKLGRASTLWRTLALGAVVVAGLLAAQIVGRHWYAQRIAQAAIANPEAAPALLAQLGELEADAIRPLLSVVQSDQPQAAAAARDELDTLLVRWQRDPWQKELRLTSPEKYVRQMKLLATGIQETVPQLSPLDQEWASLLAKRILRALPTVTAEASSDSVTSLAVIESCEAIIASSRLRGVTSATSASQLAAASPPEALSSEPSAPVTPPGNPGEEIVDLPPAPPLPKPLQTLTPEPVPSEIASSGGDASGIRVEIEVREPAELVPPAPGAELAEVAPPEPARLAPPEAVALSPDSNLPWQATRPRPVGPEIAAAPSTQSRRPRQESEREALAREAGETYAELTDRKLIEAYLTEKPDTIQRLGMSWQLTRRGFAGTQDRQLRMLVGSDERDRVALAGELLTAGNGAVPLLFLLAEDRSANVRSAAIAILGASKHPKIVERAWRLALADRDPRVAKLASELRDRLR